MLRTLRVLLSGLALTAMTMALGLGGATARAQSDTNIRVTPSSLNGWSCVPPAADTRAGGQATFVVDPTAPAGRGALRLTTDLTTTAKVQCVHATNTMLSSITELSYWTKQNAPTPPVGDPAYQLATCLTGATATGCNAQAAPNTNSSFTTLVFEPYQGATGQLIVPGIWQKWDVAAGLFWSTRTVTCSGGTIVGTPGGPATYTLAQLKTICPDALVFQFIVNVGTNNPGYDVETDLFNFNGTVYDFEPAGNASDDEDANDDSDHDNGDHDSGDHDNGNHHNGHHDDGHNGNRADHARRDS